MMGNRSAMRGRNGPGQIKQGAKEKEGESILFAVPVFPAIILSVRVCSLSSSTRRNHQAFSKLNITKGREYE